MDVVAAAFDIVTAADVSELATCGDLSATPALEIVRVVEFCGERGRHCKRKLTIKKVSVE